MGTVSTICFTDRASRVPQLVCDMVTLSLTQGCDSARWAGTEMTRTAGTQHGGDCPLPGIIHGSGSEGKLADGFRGLISS